LEGSRSRDRSIDSDHQPVSSLPKAGPGLCARGTISWSSLKRRRHRRIVDGKLFGEREEERERERGFITYGVCLSPLSADRNSLIGKIERRPQSVESFVRPSRQLVSALFLYVLSLSLSLPGLLLFSRRNFRSPKRYQKSRAARKYRDDAHNGFVVARRAEKLPKNGGDTRQGGTYRVRDFKNDTLLSESA